MNRTIVIIILIICIFSAINSKAKGSGDSNAEDDNNVEIILTKLDVNDTKLNLSWKIINNTSHDVWICDGLLPGGDPEWFLDTDNKTLLTRRRFNLLMEAFEVSRAFKGRYIRLHPEQEKEESFSFAVPIHPHSVFGHSQGNAEYAKHLALEIGFYNEDLPNTIQKVVELAEILGCSLDVSTPEYTEIRRRFFVGRDIALLFNSESFTYFRNSIISGDDEIIMPHIEGMNGEQVLRIEIDGVSIPYESSYPPLESE